MHNEIDKFSDVIEGAERFLVEIAFEEAYPTMPTVSDVQAMTAKVLRLSTSDLKRGWESHKDLPYLYVGSRLEQLVNMNWGEDKVLFNPEWIAARYRRDISTDEHALTFYMEQCFTLNVYIIDKLAQVRQMFEPQTANADTHAAVTAPALPPELDTDKARVYFARAVKAGYMEITQKGYRWLGKPSRLGYFLYKTYEHPRPQTAIDNYFAMGRLSGSISQADYEYKRADVKRWRADMDSKIFFD